MTFSPMIFCGCVFYCSCFFYYALFSSYVSPGRVPTWERIQGKGRFNSPNFHFDTEIFFFFFFGPKKFSRNPFSFLSLAAYLLSITTTIP